MGRARYTIVKYLRSEVRSEKVDSTYTWWYVGYVRTFLRVHTFAYEPIRFFEIRPSISTNRRLLRFVLRENERTRMRGAGGSVGREGLLEISRKESRPDRRDERRNVGRREEYGI